MLSRGGKRGRAWVEPHEHLISRGTRHDWHRKHVGGD